MPNRTSIDQYLLLFAPWVLASLLKDSPIISYLTAWLGSFFILYLSITGKIKPLPDDRSIAEQLMRPIFLVQLIFAGYMCCTSIFYFFDVLGYVDFTNPGNFYLVDEERLKLTAQCQRYYCLGHASFVLGILVFMRYPATQKYVYNRAGLINLIFTIALATLSLSYALLFIGGLSQFSHQLNTLSFIAGTLALAFSIPQRKTWSIIACLVIYGFNFYQALISGFKEPIILSILLLGIFLYPSYKRTVALTFVPLILSLFVLLPTYNRVFRQHAWSENASANEASQLALTSALSEDEADNWSFFAFRLSEIDMFTKYVQSSPKQVNYYGFDLVKQSFAVIIPRILWPSKPITEQVVMERVYNAGIVSRNSNVSAKPAFIVDAYLSAGPFGIFIYLFIYGAICQLIAIKAETLFGGYILGTALVFTGLFQVFWRGQSFEFLFNTVCWSYVTMHLIFWALRATKILEPN
jgi:hypothetical protein